MKQGYLSQYFEGVAAKWLSAVEADLLTSNQHEFQGVEQLTSILGEPIGKQKFASRVLYLDDSEEQVPIEDAIFTWYDTRAGERARGGMRGTGRLRWEYRLYFPTTTASLRAKTGDLLVIAKQKNNELLVLVAAQGTNIAGQIQWLLGFQNLPARQFSVKDEFDNESDKVFFASKLILDAIGVVVESTAQEYLGQMLDKFKGRFPTTRIFSEFARDTINTIDCCEDPDFALVQWMNWEEELFLTLERHLISDRLKQGFCSGVDGNADVKEFLDFSLSVQNRRKSRVGLAFENHLEYLFLKNGLLFSRTATTENKSKPDFLFPGAEQYRDAHFRDDRLFMLGAKSTCKDRWRQVLAEANRIETKHLITLEPSISPSQTTEMRTKGLQLVVPKEIQKSYASEQQKWLMDVRSFILLVKSSERVDANE